MSILGPECENFTHTGSFRGDINMTRWNKKISDEFIIIMDENLNQDYYLKFEIKIDYTVTASYFSMKRKAEKIKKMAEKFDYT